RVVDGHALLRLAEAGPLHGARHAGVERARSAGRVDAVDRAARRDADLRGDRALAAGLRATRLDLRADLPDAARDVLAARLGRQVRGGGRGRRPARGRGRSAALSTARLVRLDQTGDVV